MEHIPIPNAKKADREAIASLAERCTSLGPQRHELETQVQRRLTQIFGTQGPEGGTLNNKAQEWWLQSLNDLGDALKTRFKLKQNPFTNPRTADEWEPYLAEKRGEIERLTQELADADINARVYKLFKLTPTEIALLEREVEH